MYLLVPSGAGEPGAFMPADVFVPPVDFSFPSAPVDVTKPASIHSVIAWLNVYWQEYGYVFEKGEGDTINRVKINDRTIISFEKPYKPE